MDKYVLNSIWIVIMLTLVSSTGQGRTWTRSDGKTAEGELLSKSEKTITIKLKNHQNAEIPIASLIADDQQFIRGWVAPPPKRPIAVPKDAQFHNGSWYCLILRKVSWEKAAKEAERMGGHLVRIMDAETQEFIVNNLAKGLEVWIDGSDEKNEGIWRFGNGEKFVFTKWGPGEPSNSEGAEHYLAIGKSGFWNDTLGTIDQAQKLTGYVVQWK